jgi:hypothetical protein
MLLLGANVWEEQIASLIRVTRLGDLGSVLRLPLTINVDPSSPILVTLMMEAIRSSETPALRRVARSNIPEDGILHGDSTFLRNVSSRQHIVTSQKSVCTRKKNNF